MEGGGGSSTRARSTFLPSTPPSSPVELGTSSRFDDAASVEGTESSAEGRGAEMVAISRAGGDGGESEGWEEERFETRRFRRVDASLDLLRVIL